MTSPSRSRSALVPVALALLLWPRPAHAYLDPVIGSLVVQTIIAGVAAIGYAFRSSLLKIASLLRPARWFADRAAARDK